MAVTEDGESALLLFPPFVASSDQEVDFRGGALHFDEDGRSIPDRRKN